MYHGKPKHLILNFLFNNNILYSGIKQNFSPGSCCCYDLTSLGVIHAALGIKLKGIIEGNNSVATDPPRLIILN